MSTIAVPRRQAQVRAKSRTTDWRARYFNWFCASVLAVFAVIWVIPLLWALDTSLKPDAIIAAHPTSWWSGTWTLHAYQTLFNLGIVKWQGKMDVPGAVAVWENLLKTVPDYPERDKVQQYIAEAKKHSNITPGTKTDKPASL